MFYLEGGKITVSLQILPHLSNKVIKDIKGFQLDAFSIAYEVWRRGLTLKWYQDESNVCNLSRLNSSTSGKFFSLSTENDIHYFFRSRGDKVGNEDVRLCQNKRKTKIVLEKSNIQVPLGKRIKVSSENVIMKYAEKVGFPVVIKPVNGSIGKGVFINIQNKDAIQETLTHYKRHYSYNNCMIE